MGWLLLLRGSWSTTEMGIHTVMVCRARRGIVMADGSAPGQVLYLRPRRDFRAAPSGRHGAISGNLPGGRGEKGGHL